MPFSKFTRGRPEWILSRMPNVRPLLYGKKGERYVLYMTFTIDHSKGKEDLSKKPKH